MTTYAIATVQRYGVLCRGHWHESRCESIDAAKIQAKVMLSWDQDGYIGEVQPDGAIIAIAMTRYDGITWIDLPRAPAIIQPQSLIDWQARMRLSYYDAAKALGVSHSTYATWLNGSVRIDKRTALACAAIEAGLTPIE